MKIKGIGIEFRFPLKISSKEMTVTEVIHHGLLVTRHVSYEDTVSNPLSANDIRYHGTSSVDKDNFYTIKEREGVKNKNKSVPLIIEAHDSAAS